MTQFAVRYHADYEVDNAQLLLEQVWSDIGPGIDGLQRFFSAVDVSRHGSLENTTLIRCDKCDKPLYRTRAGRVCCLSDREAREAGALYLATIRPIVLVIGYMRLVVCSRACAVLYIEAATDDQLESGDPIPW